MNVSMREKAMNHNDPETKADLSAYLLTNQGGVLRHLCSVHGFLEPRTALTTSPHSEANVEDDSL